MIPMSHKQSRTGDILLCVFLYVPVAWLALVLAQCFGRGGLSKNQRANEISRCLNQLFILLRSIKESQDINGISDFVHPIDHDIVFNDGTAVL